MKQIKNRKVVIQLSSALFILLLMMAVTAAAPAAAGETVDIAEVDDLDELDEEESEALMQQILDDYDEIISGESNVTTATQLLAALPSRDREERSALAVYEITDNTGQMKDMGSSVVTQGATDMLITALQRSRQFQVLDRAGFNDFMNEQNLQSENRLSTGEGPMVGEMIGADYIIDGSITEYQVDRKTGGIGLSIGGLGGSKEYALATTAIDLRLVETTSGEVVWAESFKGEIEGERVGVETFSFMGDNIVEFETGRGEQEVINLVIRTLLEEAVFEMVETGGF